MQARHTVGKHLGEATGGLGWVGALHRLELGKRGRERYAEVLKASDLACGSQTIWSRLCVASAEPFLGVVQFTPVLDRGTELDRTPRRRCRTPPPAASPGQSIFGPSSGSSGGPDELSRPTWLYNVAHRHTSHAPSRVTGLLSPPVRQPGNNRAGL